MKKFTNSTYKNDGKIEINTTIGTFIVWIAGSGGSFNPSLLLLDLSRNGNIKYTVIGEIHNEISYSDGKITITTKNQYFNYGYIKLR